ncbi:hypothetical protein GCM10018966_026200 [Streptomyces yanii]
MEGANAGSMRLHTFSGEGDDTGDGSMETMVVLLLLCVGEGRGQALFGRGAEGLDKPAARRS